jgi:mannose-6-phosphate isomerase-like protein (cupin superfamily)
MFIRDIKDCAELTAGDMTTLRVLFNPLRDPLELRYSMAHARVRPGQSSTPHRLATSEVYYIIEGAGLMRIDGEEAVVGPGQAIYIPPGAVQSITNSGAGELVFICIVDPAWRPENEVIL